MVHSGKNAKELAIRGAQLAPSTAIQLIAAERAVTRSDRVTSFDECGWPWC